MTPSRRYGPRPAARSGGFSLIEIMVAVLIVSVGVLGVAGLQLISLRNNTSAMYRTQGFLAAYEIIDRARANPDQDYSILLADPIPAVGVNDCEDVACTPAQMRDFDIATWLCDLEFDAALCAFDPNLDNGGLPGGDASIVWAQNTDGVTGITTTTVSVTVQWQDDRTGGAPLSVTVETTL